MSKQQEKKRRGRQREYNASALVRCTGDELAELHRRRQAADAPRRMSLSRYLVECGLRSQNPPDPRERELRERALFELRKAGVNLNQIARRLNQPTGTIAASQVEQAAAAVERAASLVAEVYGRGR